MRQLRIQHGKNQEQFGELCGVSKGMVSQWESDTVTIPVDRVIALRRQMDFSIDWLLTGEVKNYDTRLRPPLVELMKVAEKLPDIAVSKLAREGSAYAELIEDACRIKQNGTQ